MGGRADGSSAVVFDFFGTLTPPTPPAAWRESTSRIANHLGVDAGALAQVLIETDTERMTGALGDPSEMIRALAERLGVTPSAVQVEAARSARASHQRRIFRPRPETIPTIAALRAQGKRIGVLSDCAAELPEAWSELPYAEYVDAAVFSCVVGMRKPDRRLYDLISQRLGTRPADCLYIGDGYGRELSGARSAGMRAVLLAGSDWPGEVMGALETDWDGERIASLTELRS